MRGHIRRQGHRSWAVVVDVGRDPRTGKRKQKWFTVRGLKRDAEKFLAKVLVELETSRPHGLAEHLTLGEYLHRWLAGHAAGKLSWDSYKSYEMIIHKHLIPALGHIRLTELKPLDIQSYLNRALSYGRLDGKGGLSRRSVQYHYAVLHKALKNAVKWELISKNPAEAVDPPSPPKHKPEVIPPEMIPAFLEAVRDTGVYFVPLLLAVTTGMRREEVLGLRWQDVDLALGVAKVVQVLKRENGALVFRPPKTEKSSRPVVLLPSTVRVLKDHRAEQLRLKELLGSAYASHDLVCCKPDGTPIVPDTFSSFFRDWIRRHPEFPRVTLHGLRHTHATTLMGLGVHPKVVSERLGHSTISVTLDLYTHYLPHLQKEAAQRLDQAVSLSCPSHEPR